MESEKNFNSIFSVVVRIYKILVIEVFFPLYNHEK